MSDPRPTAIDPTPAPYAYTDPHIALIDAIVGWTVVEGGVIENGISVTVTDGTTTKRVDVRLSKNAKGELVREISETVTEQIKPDEE